MDLRFLPELQTVPSEGGPMASEGGMCAQEELREKQQSTLPTTETPVSSAKNNDNNNNNNDGTRSSASSDTQDPRTNKTWRTHLLAPITTHRAYIPLLVSSFVSGLNDGSSFAAWGTFTGMQTGNTIFLALGASHQPPSPPYVWLKALVAIAAFLLACFAVPRVQRLFGHAGLTRVGLFVSFSLQAGCLIVAAGLVQGAVVPQPYGTLTPTEMDPAGGYLIELVPIALMAFQAGGQITASRMLGFGEIPTIVLTSAYCDLASDKQLFTAKNGKRDRRLLSAVALLVGAIVGGWLTRSHGRLESVLWLGSFLKLSIAVSWLFWRSKDQDSGVGGELKK